MTRGTCQRVMWVLITGVALTAGGCSPATSALSKLQNGLIGSISADEWLALVGLGSSVGIPIPPLTRQEAEAIVAFLEANNIETLDDLERVMASGEIEIPPELEAIFGA